MQASTLGLSLTLGLPLATCALAAGGWTFAAALLPPGTVHAPGNPNWQWTWASGTLVGGGLALFLARQALAHCEEQLRRWLDGHHVAAAGND
jgi:hypothetical protein